jgi:hypothetical protein
MTAALSSRFPGVVVDDVRVGPVEDGTNARARVALRSLRGTGPRSVFVKRSGSAVHRLALLALGALATEARLAASGTELPLDHPAHFAGGVSWGRLATVVVMEDVTTVGGIPNEATTPLGVDEVASGLEGLARLHVAFPADRLPPSLRFLRPWRLGRGWSAVSVASLVRGIRRVESSGSRVAVSPVVLGRQFRQSALLAASGHQCLLHGDPHPGNTYSLPGWRTGFLDWQLARLGHWSHDVGYFLVGSLSVVDRRAHERWLLARYLDAVGRAGGEVPSWETAWARYRATPAFGLATWVHTVSFGRLQPADVCLATIGRFAAAYEDLGTRSAL